MDDLLREFLTETSEHLDIVDVELVRFEKNPSDQAILRNIFRLVHTIKGTCGFLELPRLESLAHAAETLMGQVRDGRPVTTEVVTLVLATVDRIKLILAELDRLKTEPEGSDGDLIDELDAAVRLGGASAQHPRRPGDVPLGDLERAFQTAPGPSGQGDPGSPAPARAEIPAAGLLSSPTVRVGVDVLEHLMTTVSELVLTRNQLLDIARRQDSDVAFRASLQRLSSVTAELQEGIMKTRMQPIGAAWAKLPRVVRDVANDLGKEIELVMEGAGTELDRQILDLVRDPLTHMVRNSADHGIERPDERLAKGKPRVGRIRLHASQHGGTMSIEIADDGRGLDMAAIRRRIVEGGLASEAELARMGDEQVAGHIFQAGFSTSHGVNIVSGRGVGMDVVKTNIALVGGTVGIRSEAGLGTTFRMDIPLTLAIVAALIVQVGPRRFALPQMAVAEIVRIGPGSEHTIARIDGAALLRLRSELLPVVDLGTMLDVARTGTAQSFVAVMQVGRQRFGLVVDLVLDTEEIVVKAMSSALRRLPLFSGNTILGDGSVVLILDPTGIAREIAPDFVWAATDELPAALSQDGPADATTTLLVFRGHDRVPKAVPLPLVARLEEIDAAAIEWSSGRAYLQYRGGLMPLLPVDANTPIRREGTQPVIVFADEGHALGLAVAEIIDVAEVALAVTPLPDRPDLIGSGVVRGRVTEIIDLASYLPVPRSGGEARALARTPGHGGEPVLLVDAKAFFREMLAPVVKAAGHDVRLASSREEARAEIARGDLRAVIVDLDGRDEDGFGVVEALRALPAHHDLPVIGLTSRPSATMSKRAEGLGIAALVAKFDRSRLLAALSDQMHPLRIAS